MRPHGARIRGLVVLASLAAALLAGLVTAGPALAADNIRKAVVRLRHHMSAAVNGVQNNRGFPGFRPGRPFDPGRVGSDGMRQPNHFRRRGDAVSSKEKFGRCLGGQ